MQARVSFHTASPWANSEMVMVEPWVAPPSQVWLVIASL
jgi:hypothetical protein